MAYRTVESLFVGIGKTWVFNYTCFDEVMLLYMLYVVFVCLETLLTDPLTKPPRLRAITTPVKTPAYFDC